MVNSRVRTYITGIDELMEGGVPARSVVLVCGVTGAMKSTLAFSILYQNALHQKKNGVFISLKQERESILEHMIKLNMNPNSLNKMGSDAKLLIADLAPIRKLKSATGINWIEKILDIVQSFKNKYACDIVAIDSLTDLHSLTTLKSPRRDISALFEKLRELNMTTFVISNIPDPETHHFGVYGFEEVLADGIIHIEMERDRKRVNQFLSIVKMRNTKHERSYFPLLFDNSKFEIVTD